ncbi:MAG: tetratricopeptide repeat protein [Desulfobacterales bacterium]|nr:tetratricopeptide repeat protein [Desulfobacterales bacterium]
MKRYLTATSILLMFYFLSCAVSNTPVDQTDKRITQGMKQISNGTDLYQKGCYDYAMACFLRAHELFASCDHLKGIALSMNDMGNIYLKTGDFETAALFFDEAHHINLDMGDSDSAAKALSNKAVALMEAGKLDAAEKSLDNATLICSDASQHPDFLKYRAQLSIKKNNFKEAEILLLDALSSIGSKEFSSIGSTNFALGDLMKKSDRYNEAISYFKAALTADKKSAISIAIAEDLFALGESYFLLEKYDMAADYFKRSLKIFLLTENMEKIDAVKKALSLAAENADIDLTLIQYFIVEWEKGVILEHPCR